MQAIDNCRGKIFQTHLPYQLQRYQALQQNTEQRRHGQFPFPESPPHPLPWRQSMRPPDSIVATRDPTQQCFWEQMRSRSIGIVQQRKGRGNCSSSFWCLLLIVDDASFFLFVFFRGFEVLCVKTSTATQRVEFFDPTFEKISSPSVASEVKRTAMFFKHTAGKVGDWFLLLLNLRFGWSSHFQFEQLSFSILKLDTRDAQSLRSQSDVGWKDTGFLGVEIWYGMRRMYGSGQNSSSGTPFVDKNA